MTTSKQRNARRRADDVTRRAIVDLLWDRYNSADGKRYGIISQARLAALLQLPQSRVGRAMNGPRLQRICQRKHPGYRVLMRKHEAGYLYHIARHTFDGDFANTLLRLQRGDPVLERSVEELKTEVPYSETVRYLTEALQANGVQRRALVKALAEQRVRVSA